jgi:hypothetical protein
MRRRLRQFIAFWSERHTASRRSNHHQRRSGEWQPIVFAEPGDGPTGQTVVWHNIDTTTHRVVLNDGKLDTGNLAPGAFSQPMTLGAPGPYHCSIHPDMVGTLVNQ